MAKTKGQKIESEVVRIAFRLHARELAQIREVRDLMSLNTELDACRYLMQRGLEAMSGQLGNRRLADRIQASMSAEHMIAAMVKIMGPEVTQGLIEADAKEGGKK